MKTETLRSIVIKKFITNATNISKQMDNSLGMIHGIGLTEYMVLSNLSDSPMEQMRRIDIADAVGLTASAITRMLIPMEKIGLISKEVNARDARVSLVRLTSSGKKILDEASNTFNTKSDEILKDLNQKQLDELFTLIK